MITIVDNSFQNCAYLGRELNWFLLRICMSVRMLEWEKISTCNNSALTLQAYFFLFLNNVGIDVHLNFKYTEKVTKNRKDWSLWFIWYYEWLVLLQVPKYFGLVQMFWARPKIYMHVVPVPKNFCHTKRWLPFSKLVIVPAQKFWRSIYAIKFLDWFKKFGLSQKILGPEDEQGIR